MVAGSRNVRRPRAMGTGVSYTLLCEAASLSLTGQAINLEYHRLLALAAASLSLAGQDINLEYHHVLPIESGSLTLSGQDVTLRFGYALTIEAGALTLATQDVSLIYDRVIDVAAASVTLTGQDINLEYHHVLSLAGASMTIAGQDVGFIRGYAVIVGSASLTLAGQDVGLIRDAVITLSAASLTLAGQDVALRFGYSLILDPGSLTLTGSVVGLTADRTLPLNTATLTLAAQDTGLLHNHTLTAGGGIMTIAGSVVSLDLNRAIIVEAAAITLTGQDVTLTKQTNAMDTPYFYVSNNGTALASVAWGSTISGRTFIFAEHDPTADKIRISINNGTPVEISHTTGINVDASQLDIAAANTGSDSFYPSRIGHVLMGKSPSISLSSIRAALYNGGIGQLPGNLSASQISGYGAVAGWDFDEASGTRADAIGSNDLTDNNTVPRAVGTAANTGLGLLFDDAASGEARASNDATLQTGDILFIIAADVLLTEKPAADMHIFGKSDHATSGEWALYYDNVADRIAFFIQNGVTQRIVNADTLGSPATNTWYRVMAWHDPDADTVNIQIKPFGGSVGAVDSATTSATAPATTTEDITVGRADDNTLPLSGAVDACALWKNTILTSDVRAEYFALVGDLL